jgi:hypothetical protein
MPASLLFALAAAVASPAGSPADLPALDKDPTAMSQSEIRTFNTGRPASDPDFIRCRRAEETGSLVHKRFTCHTTSQWAVMDRQGNDTGRDVYDEFVSKASRTSN